MKEFRKILSHHSSQNSTDNEGESLDSDSWLRLYL
jgi:hypothetical protein